MSRIEPVARPKPEACLPMSARLLNLAGATVQVFANPEDARRAAAEEVARVIRRASQTRARAAIGLATGSTPVPVYERLVAMHKGGELSFSGVSTFNLDEYYPISPADPRSYRSYMDRHLFRHVDLAPNRTHVLDGTVPESFVAEHAALFDRMIAAEGGLDFQLLGVGRNGHIGFNEPTQMPVDEALKLPTRSVVLHPVTLADAAGEFGDSASVPLRALTLGVAPILAARSILVLAFGARKAEPLARALTGPMTAELPASLLQHAAGRVTWMVDEAAAGGLD
jgi:glucosamine-6-phosphate deaminase